MDDGTTSTERELESVQVVGGQPYSFTAPPRAPFYLLVVAVATCIITGDWAHLAGAGAVLLIGAMGANPRLSPVGAGGLPFLLFVGAVVAACTHPRIGIPIVAWSAVAWVAGSVELRMKMKPYAPAKPAPNEPIKTA